MKLSYKVVGINLAILLLYSIIIRLNNIEDKGRLGILLGSCVIISIHVFMLILIGLVLQGMDKKELGRSFLLSSAFVLVIGFGVCLGNASI
jgi:hypothetical protein